MSLLNQKVKTTYLYLNRPLSDYIDNLLALYFPIILLVHDSFIGNCISTQLIGFIQNMFSGILISSPTAMESSKTSA